MSLGASVTVALGICALLVATQRHHGHLTHDSNVGVQKVHAQPTPRVGGLGIYFGLFAGWFVSRDSDVRAMLGVLLLAGIPALLCGLLEDVTKRVGVLPRLIATMASSVCASWMTGIFLQRLSVPGLDWILGIAPIAIVFTAIAVGGLANALNIIDGFHGLASGTALIALAGLGVIALHVGDSPLAFTAFTVAAAIAGFWLMNYPWGKLFLGDGGAYFVGFSLAWVAVLLPVRNPAVSPWASFLVCAYPVIEVIYSALRRRAQGRPASHPDGAHLHHLIRNALRGHHHAWVSPIVWALNLAPVLLAIALYDGTALLALAALGCAIAYHCTHRVLASFPAVASA